MYEPVTVLVVASKTVLEQLRQILTHTRWNMSAASTVAESTEFLRRQASVVLVCQVVLPDGNWRDLLTHTLRLSVPPPLVVVAPHADERLWMEVLNCGGYNLLGQPLRDSEVFQVISHAWMHLRTLASSTLIV